MLPLFFIILFENNNVEKVYDANSYNRIPKLINGQSNKDCRIVNYNSRVVLTKELPRYSTTLESQFTVSHWAPILIGHK